MPPMSAENAMERPSGDQDGVNTSPSSGSRISRSRAPSSTAMIVSRGRPRLTPASTNRLPSGLHPPADAMNCRLSRCGSTAVRVSFRMISPVSMSPM